MAREKDDKQLKFSERERELEKGSESERKGARKRILHGTKATQINIKDLSNISM